MNKDKQGTGWLLVKDMEIDFLCLHNLSKFKLTSWLSCRQIECWICKVTNWYWRNAVLYNVIWNIINILLSQCYQVNNKQCAQTGFTGFTLRICTRSSILPKISCENLHVKCGFEPWLKGPFFGAMAQTHQSMDIKPWLKLIKYQTLSHSSNTHIIGIWAMALTHQLLDFEPWLKWLIKWGKPHTSSCN